MSEEMAGSRHSFFQGVFAGINDSINVIKKMLIENVHLDKNTLEECIFRIQLELSSERKKEKTS